MKRLAILPTPSAPSRRPSTSHVASSLSAMPMFVSSQPMSPKVDVSVPPMISFETTGAQNAKNLRCYPDESRCAGANGKPAVAILPCCSRGYSCLPKPGDWGKFCQKDEASPKESFCHRDDTRCAGVPGYPEVANLPCCSFGFSCRSKASALGRFCQKDAKSPISPQCHLDNVRCAGPPGHAQVPHRPCCSTKSKCMSKSGSWGLFCLETDEGTLPPPLSTTLSIHGGTSVAGTVSVPSKQHGSTIAPEATSTLSERYESTKMSEISSTPLKKQDGTSSSGAGSTTSSQHRNPSALGATFTPLTKVESTGSSGGHAVEHRNERIVDGKTYSVGLHIIDKEQVDRVLILSTGEAYAQARFLYVPSDDEISAINANPDVVLFSVSVNDSKIVKESSVSQVIVQVQSQRPYYEAVATFEFESFVGITSFQLLCTTGSRSLSYDGFYTISGIVLTTKPGTGRGSSYPNVLSGPRGSGLFLGYRPHTISTSKSGSNSGNSSSASILAGGGSLAAMSTPSAGGSLLGSGASSTAEIPAATSSPFSSGAPPTGEKDRASNKEVSQSTTIAADGTRYEVLTLEYQSPKFTVSASTIVQAIKRMQVTVINVESTNGFRPPVGLLSFNNSVCSPLTGATFSSNGEWHFEDDNCDIALRGPSADNAGRGLADIVIRVAGNRRGESICQIAVPSASSNNVLATTAMTIYADTTLPSLSLDGKDASTTRNVSLELDFYGRELLNFTMLNTKEPRQRENCTEYFLNLPGDRYAKAEGDLSVLGIAQQNVTFVSAAPTETNEALRRAVVAYSEINEALTHARSPLSERGLANTTAPQVNANTDSETHAFVRIGNDSTLVRAVNTPVECKIFTRFASPALAKIDSLPAAGNKTFVLQVPLEVVGYTTKNFSEFKSRQIKVALAASLDMFDSEPTIFRLASLTSTISAVAAQYNAYFNGSKTVSTKIVRALSDKPISDDEPKAIVAAVQRRIQNGQLARSVRVREMQIFLSERGVSLRVQSSNDLISGLGGALGVGGIISIVLLTTVPAIALCIGLALAAKRNGGANDDNSMRRRGGRRNPVEHSGLFIASDNDGRGVNGVNKS